MKRGKPHAPFAPGPRLGTWWKENQLTKLLSWIGKTKTPPPIYTRPTPKKQKHHDTSYHPAMFRLPASIRAGSTWKGMHHKARRTP